MCNTEQITQLQELQTLAKEKFGRAMTEDWVSVVSFYMEQQGFTADFLALILKFTSKVITLPQLIYSFDKLLLGVKRTANYAHLQELVRAYENDEVFEEYLDNFGAYKGFKNLVLS